MTIHEECFGRPQFVSARSPSYWAVVRTARRASGAFAGGRGMGAVDKILKPFVPLPSTLITLRLNADTLFDLPATDSYWGHYLLSGREYEPEVRRFLCAIRDLHWGLIDGGANFGYWSCLASSSEFGHHRAVAVEMSPKSLQLLRTNAARNSNRFHIVEAPIGPVPGATVHWSEADRHSARSTAHSSHRRDRYTAQTVTLDELARLLDPNQGIVLKLDIEGVEAAVIRSMARIRSKPDHVILFEDHYSETDCPNVAVCLELEYKVAFPMPDGSVLAITSISDAQGVKKQVNKGYNFIAYKPHAEAHMANLVQQAVERGRWLSASIPSVPHD